MNSQYSNHIQTQSQNKQTPFNKAYFASKSELLNWASKILDLELISLEQMVTGAIFCQLLDACHPGTVRLNKVNWKANNEIDYIANFKLFQQGLVTNDIYKPIDINRLTKGKQYDLNELLQWIYGYYLSIKDNIKEIYNAKRKRGGQAFVFNDKKNEIRNKYRKRINLGQYSNTGNHSSNCSINSDINYQRYQRSNSNSSVNQLKQNLRNNNYCMNNEYRNNNTYNQYNQYEDNRYRNRSKQEMRNNRYHDFEERVLNNNNIYTQNKNVQNINTINSNNIYRTVDRHPSNSNLKEINLNNEIYNTNNINTNNANNINGNYTSESKRNFKNIFEKTPYDYETYTPNQINPENENINANYEEEDLNNELENENNLDITDFFGLNEEETKNLIRQEKKDGNKIHDLKNIIRKLRINMISMEKDLANVKKAISEEYKLKNFYLNKLRDIEYLYFNPVIKNSNENKNTILRQLLCSNQDSTIFLDENNYAFLRNVNDKENIINNKSSKRKKDNINEDIMMENKISNDMSNIRNEINMENNTVINNKMNDNDNNNNNYNRKLNYSSKKNYDPNYMDNLFDSFTDNTKTENQINSNIRSYGNNIQILPIKMVKNNESKLTQYSSTQNNNISNNTFYTKYTDDINNNNENININCQNDNGKIEEEKYNGKKYLSYSVNKKENLNEEKNNLNNRTAFKGNSIYDEISSLLLNEPLNIQVFKNSK